jgi:hypothetical protein
MDPLNKTRQARFVQYPGGRMKVHAAYSPRPSSTLIRCLLPSLLAPPPLLVRRAFSRIGRRACTCPLSPPRSVARLSPARCPRSLHVTASPARARSWYLPGQRAPSASSRRGRQPRRHGIFKWSDSDWTRPWRAAGGARRATWAATHIGTTMGAPSETSLRATNARLGTRVMGTAGKNSAARRWIT